MQTFFPFKSLHKSMTALDTKRLCKQRVEAIQIAECLMGIGSTRWGNHPAVKMWRGYEAYLIREYIPATMSAWSLRGIENRGAPYANTKSLERWKLLSAMIQDREVVKPKWITVEFCTAHQSNLIRKNSEHYRPIFGYTVSDSLDYIWP